MDRLFNILRGIVVASYLDTDTKRELLDFLIELEEKKNKND